MGIRHGRRVWALSRYTGDGPTFVSSGSGEQSPPKSMASAAMGSATESMVGVPQADKGKGVVTQLQDCAASLDVWNRTCFQRLRREIVRTKGQIRSLGLLVNATSWHELLTQEGKLDQLFL
ncbi:hypothetical protein ACOSQ2_029055 [Xanthoceras sorbifolium]